MITHNLVFRKVVVPKNQRKLFPDVDEVVGDCECGHIVANCDKYCSQCGSELKWGVDDDTGK